MIVDENGRPRSGSRAGRFQWGTSRLGLAQGQSGFGGRKFRSVRQ